MNSPSAELANSFAVFERPDACPACGSGMIGTFMEPDIAQCRSCKVLFRNPRPTQDEIARSYNTGGTFAAWQDEETARTEMWERRAAIIGRFQPHGDLLDVGTGDGRFLLTCRERGYRVRGTEVSSTGADYALRRGLDVQLGQFNDLQFPAASFDIVTIWHVLEHVPNPGEVLRNAYAVLRPGGILAVAVPNEENYFVRRLLPLPSRTSPFGVLPFGGEIHLTYFRPVTLRATLRNAGFEVVEFGVDDIYSVRDWKMKLKLAGQRFLSRLFNWHFGFAMYAIGRKPTTGGAAA